MYSVGAYFLEIFPESIPGDGWTGEVRFSRRNDYRQHADVPKVTYSSHIYRESSASVEAAMVAWAREFVASSSDVLESSLKIAGASDFTAAARPARQAVHDR